MNYINKKDLKKIVENAPTGVNETDIVNSLVKRGYTVQGINDTEKKTFLGGLLKEVASPLVKGGQMLSTGLPVVGAAIKSLPAAIGLGNKEEARQKISSAASKAVIGQKQMIETPLGRYTPITSGKEALGTALEGASWLVGGGGAKTVVKQALKTRALQAAKVGIKVGLKSGALYGAGSALSRGENLGGAIGGGITGGILGGVGGAVLGGAAVGAGAGARTIGRQLGMKLQPVAKQVEQRISSYIAKSIKPRIANLSEKQLQNLQRKQVEAFKVLAQNKNVIKFKDDLGYVVKRLPQTVREVATAISDVKTNLFNRYDKLAKQAGAAGANFNPIKTLASLNKYAEDLGHGPGLRNYAKELLDEIIELRGENPSIVQSRIQELNESLSGYFAGRVEKGKTALDASVAKMLREELDDVIFNFTGKDYQALRSQYAALKSVEKDVLKQAQRMLSKQQKSLIDITDVFTGGDLISGILTLDPIALTRGVASRAIKEYYKKLNNPDRYIQKIFQELGEKAAPSLQSIKLLPKAVKEGVQDVLKSIKPGLTIEDVSLPKGKGEILKTTPLKSDLINEAKKYKSAKEFVRKQPVIYHGSSVPLKRFSDKKGGVYFTDSMEDASGYAGDIDNVYEGYLNLKNPLIIDAKGAKWDNLNTKWGKSTQEIVSMAEKDGYDGVTFKNIVDNVLDTDGMGESTVHYVYKPATSFINKSQLIDIWNKAHIKSTKKVEVPAKLERSINNFSKEKPQHFTKVLKNYINNKYVNELKYRLNSGYANSNQGSLYYLLNNKDIFKKYPQLKNFDVIFDNKVKGGAYINVEKEIILIDPAYLKGYIDGLPNLLKHEVQHAKDFYDLGKSMGGSPDMFLDDFKAMRFAFNDIKNRAINYKDLVTIQELKELNYAINQMEKGYKPAKYLIDKYIEPESYKLYLRLWGENNARLKSLDVRKKVPNNLLIKDLEVK